MDGNDNLGFGFGFGFGYGYGYGDRRRQNPSSAAAARIAAAQAAAQATVRASKQTKPALQNIPAVRDQPTMQNLPALPTKPKEADVFRSFLNTTREEHREQLSEATKAIRKKSLPQRTSLTQPQAGTAEVEQDEREQKRKESVTKTYYDFILSKRQQSARERIKQIKKYGYNLQGREHFSFIHDGSSDRRQSERRYTFPMDKGGSIRQPGFLKDISTRSFADETKSSKQKTSDLSAILAEGSIRWDEPQQKEDVSRLLLEEWEMSLASNRSKSYTTRDSSFLKNATRATDKDISFVARDPTFLKVSPPTRRNARAMNLSKFLNEADPNDFPFRERLSIAEKAMKAKRDPTGRGFSFPLEKDQSLKEPSFLKDLSKLSGYTSESIYKDELSKILAEGKIDWDKNISGMEASGGDLDKSFIEVLEQLKEDPDKDYLINDVYYPGVIDDAINGKIDFNKLAFTIAFLDEEIPEDTPPPDKQPISLVEAFDMRFEKHKGAIKKTTNQKLAGKILDLTEQASTVTMDESVLPPDISNTRLMSFLPDKKSLTRILNREELVLASTMPIDVSTIVQNKPINELIKAMNSLEKAAYMNDYDKSAQAAEEAFNRAPPELAESAAIFGARNFRTVELTKQHAKIKTDSPYRPIEVVSYMGITKPMPGVRI